MRIGKGSKHPTSTKGRDKGMKTTAKRIYRAYCIEHGERFESMFQTAETSPARIREMGQEMAAEWGGECTSVKEWKPETFIKIKDKKTGEIITTTEKKYARFEAGVIKVKDNTTGKIISTTDRKIGNWLAQVPQSKKEEASKRYTTIGRGTDRYEEVERFQEPAPKDLWDCDKTDKENLKGFGPKAYEKSVMGTSEPTTIKTENKAAFAAAAHEEAKAENTGEIKGCVITKTPLADYTKSCLMKEAKDKGIKYFRILNKVELVQVLTLAENTTKPNEHPEISAIVASAKARWTAGQDKTEQQNG